MTWQYPWVISGLSELSLDVARAMIYTATGGREGVVSTTDCKVSALGTPGASVVVSGGAFVCLNRFTSATSQSYVGYNVGNDTKGITASGPGGRTDLVYAHITDPGQPGQPGTPAIVQTRVIEGVSSTVTKLSDVPGYSNVTGLALARIAIPASTSIITQAMITDLRGFLTEAANNLVGVMQMYVGSTPPSGYLLCDGSAISRTTYANLFAVMGTQFGAGDGSTTFNLPDLRDRFPIGVSATKSRGSKGGSATITVTNMPVHSHTFVFQYTDTTTGGGSLNRVTDIQNLAGGGGTGKTATTSSAGSGSAYYQPYQALNFIVKY